MITTASRRVDILPADLSRFVGRRAEAAATKRLLTESRLVTLTGTGGVGKSRLALHVARLVRAAFRDGVCLVSLTDLRRPELVASTVMAAMSDGPRPAGLEELVELVSGRHLLLVLDNCEHVAAAAAELATELLRRCPNLRILTTSRERLRVDGEATFLVPPLSVPEAGKRLSPREMTQYDALVLFLDRAASLNPSTMLTEEELDAIVALCRSLDGLPLAIELVAGRTGALPLEALLQRQGDLLRLLAPGTRSAPVRHQTLRATVDYSYELCSESARLLWERMAVFAGGSNLDAILAVCSGPALPTEDLDDALAELVDKSIVTFDGRRYQMLETLRQYGVECLRSSGGELTVRRAHRDYFAAVLDDASGPGQLLAEPGNLRAALDFCLSDPREVSAGLRVATSLWESWVAGGLLREGRHWLNDLLAGHPSRSPDRAAALWVSGYLAVLDGDLEEGLSRAEECRLLGEELGRSALSCRDSVEAQACVGTASNWRRSGAPTTAPEVVLEGTYACSWVVEVLHKASPFLTSGAERHECGVPGGLPCPERDSVARGGMWSPSRHLTRRGQRCPCSGLSRSVTLPGSSIGSCRWP